MNTREIKRIPISQIQIVNPRPRTKATFRALVNNISSVGLKKPITVASRTGTGDGASYDLVCGQGRLEAVLALGGRDIPAILSDAPVKQRYLMSLIENVARRRPRGSELVGEVRRLKKAGTSNTAIAERLGLGRSYINGVVRLLKCGEDRLVDQVEAGTIPLSIAVEIATTGDVEVQRALNEAYEAGELRGAKLRAVERLLAKRTHQKSAAANVKANLTGPELLKEYEESTSRQRALVKRASLVHERLAILTAAMKDLLADKTFVRLVRAEGIETIPQELMSRIASVQSIEVHHEDHKV